MKYLLSIVALILCAPVSFAQVPPPTDVLPDGIWKIDGSQSTMISTIAGSTSVVNIRNNIGTTIATFSYPPLFGGTWYVGGNFPMTNEWMFFYRVSEDLYAFLWYDPQQPLVLLAGTLSRVIG